MCAARRACRTAHPCGGCAVCRATLSRKRAPGRCTATHPFPCPPACAQAILAQHKAVKQVLLCGIETHVCILQTRCAGRNRAARSGGRRRRAGPVRTSALGPTPPPYPQPLPSLDLLERGYEVHVVTDGVSSQRLTDRGARGCPPAARHAGPLPARVRASLRRRCRAPHSAA